MFIAETPNFSFLPQIFKDLLWSLQNLFGDSHMGLFKKNEKRKFTGHKHVIPVAKIYLKLKL